MIQYYYTKKEWGVVMEKEELKILEELRRILTISFLSKLNLAEAVMCQTFLTHRRFALHKIRCQEVMK